MFHTEATEDTEDDFLRVLRGLRVKPALVAKLRVSREVRWPDR